MAPTIVATVSAVIATASLLLGPAGLFRPSAVTEERAQEIAEKTTTAALKAAPCTSEQRAREIAAEVARAEISGSPEVKALQAKAGELVILITRLQTQMDERERTDRERAVVDRGLYETMAEVRRLLQPAGRRP